MALAPPNVAAEMTVWSRFWRATLRSGASTTSGKRARPMARMAPTIEVFGVMPTRVSNSSPITTPSKASAMAAANTTGSKTVG